MSEIQIPGLDIPAFLRAVESPYDTQNVFNLIKTMVQSPNAAYLGQALREATASDQGLKQLYNDRFIPKLPTNDELLAYPEHSLGRTLGEHLIRNKINLDFEGINTHVYDRNETFDEYVRQRALRIHDVLHIVTGADTSPMGEGQLSAFQWAQYKAAFHSIAVSYKTLHVCFYDHERVSEWIHLLTEALNAGQKAVPVFGIPWELYWAENVDELRERFKINKLTAATVASPKTANA